MAIQYPNPMLSVTKGQMVEWLKRMQAEKAALPDAEQMRDNSGTVIAAILNVLSEFEDEDDVMAMVSKLPWVD